MPRPQRTGRFSEVDDPERSAFRPQLTSLIDMMTFLLVFLIKSFSVDGNIITPAANLELPISTAQTKPRVTTTIEVSKTDVMVDGRSLAKIVAFINVDSLLIPAVYQWMNAQHSLYADSIEKHEVLIQADRETEYAVLKRIMFSCSKAGFTDFTVLAQKKE